ncbi:hypothetical protein Back11_05100 [Paenibacillus baekrokdamisoli]|uniref:Uncharacterized protein n=1 Tax=Paenibacillus baekrokdamisoli TaxID=1712516 RepID=A0A3G9IT07_9BACL|nr:hypothetical protein [Paenibacillus baekrokdamisoli]MBB3067648.1 ribosomal protein L34E [Paenibacillus baekrokdamisoli]BBH19165.1 hypothetical protein Back11_05100 [Paenibacillus baekrokdamisoli]
MNKLIIVIMCAAFMILTTGCEGVFNTIKKNTVMVKKVTNEHKTNEINYDGVLSQEAVKTLSLNAVNKYYNEKLTMNEVQFELMAVEQKKLKDLLQRIHYGVVERPQVILGSQVDFAEALNKIPNGLFYMTLTQSSAPNDVYDIVLNARDGDVVKVSKKEQEPRAAYGDTRQTMIVDEMSGIAAQFIQDKGSYALTELTLDKKSIRWGSNVELFYMSKGKQTLSYSVVVDLITKQVVGFNKDVMAILSYYSQS